MIAVAESLNRIAASWHDRLSDTDREEIEDVLDAAEQFTIGALPVYEFARLSSGKTRFLAMISTPESDPRRLDLLTAIDGLLTYQGLRLTPAGIRDRSAAA